MEKYDSLIEKTFLALCDVLGMDHESVYYEIYFESKEEIKSLNRDFRGINKPTDVLSFPLLEITPGTIPTRELFPLDVNPETGLIELGDIFICEAVARKQTKTTLDDEIAFLFVHGMLHLLGYTHDTDSDEAVMNELTNKILRSDK
ncbi:MAG: rRNA maturation RNase YbeY [Firmicutes bacterium]|nr:rRNA maturation RNase YbeY [Bacillota bacterium]